MVYTRDLKSLAPKGLWVRVPPLAPSRIVSTIHKNSAILLVQLNKEKTANDVAIYYRRARTSDRHCAY